MGQISEELVIKLEIIFGLLCSKNPDDGEYCLTKFHKLEQQDWDSVDTGYRRRRRRRRKKEELAELDGTLMIESSNGTCRGTLLGTDKAGVEGYAECDSTAGTKECWDTWCNANCKTASGMHPACAYDTDHADSVTVHTRCVCSATTEGRRRRRKKEMTCPLTDAQKTELGGMGCCWGDAIMWSAQSEHLPDLHAVSHVMRDCDVEQIKKPCSTELKSTSIELLVTLGNVTTDFSASNVQQTFKSAVARTAGVTISEVSIVDFDDTELTTTTLAEADTISVDATLTLVGDHANNQGSVKSQVGSASSLQTSLATTASGTSLDGAKVTTVSATDGYSENSAAQLQISWLCMCALVLCTATHIAFV
jgi:hypothetical protein